MYRKFNIIVLLIIVANKIIQNLAVENVHLHQSLQQIIKHSFIEEDSRLLFYLNFNKSSNKELYLAGDFVNGVLPDINNATYKIFYQYKKRFVNLRHNEIILFDSLEAFRYFFKDIYNVGNMNLSRTLMFISSITTLDFYTISLVFKDLYFMGVLTIALIVKLASDNIIMITYFPFTPTSCHDTQPVIINHYLPDQKRWANLNYFPDKLKDFYGCTLTCCVWDQMPYFGIKYDPENGSVVDYIGIEGELLKFVGQNKNFSTKLHVMGNDEPKDVYNKGFILTKLFSETCDFALGGFVYKQGLNHTTFSQSNYFFLSHIHMVTNVFKAYGTYEKMLLPFHYIVWYTLGIIFVISSLVICICERRRQWQRYRNFLIGSANRTPYFNLYAVAMGANMSYTQLPKHNFPRFVLTCWILATLVLRSAYQSGMYQMYRGKLQWNPPQTIEQVFKQNYLISMTPENRKYLTILPEVKRIRIFNTTILAAFPELINSNESIAFITPHAYFEYFSKVNATQVQHLHVVPERLLTQQLTFYVRHNSYLIHEINEQISNALYYGYSWRLRRKYSPPSTNANDIDKNSTSNIKALSMSELGDLFMILIWLNLFSLAIFFIELMWYNYGKLLKLDIVKQ